MSDTIVKIDPYWYREKDCLGKGAFGEVYKGGNSQQGADQPIAIKRILKTKDLEEFLEREIQILQELSAPDVEHSHLVSLLDCIGTDRHVYLVMEFCNGGDLDHYLRDKGRMDEASIKIFLQQMASALKILHSHKVVHRDLKPANILLSYNGPRKFSNITFKIADFGVGRFLKEGEAAQTFCGTPVFMAPEIFSPRPKYDYKADLWSIGAIVYNCLTGTYYSAFQNEPVKFSSNISSSLHDLLDNLLCREPAKRLSFDAFYDHPFIGLTSCDVLDAKKAKSKVLVPRISRTEGLLWMRRIASVTKISSQEPAQSASPVNYKSPISKNPPESFKLIPIEKGSSVEPRPSSANALQRSLTDENLFEKVDLHALEVSKEEHKSVRDLVWHLIFARKITDELEKARVIFVWLCCKDLTKLKFGNADKDSPEELLTKLQNRYVTYAVAYEKLCSFVGVHCELIRGHAKGNAYKPGMKITGEQYGHSWNAVYANGVWRLLDCIWARTKLVGKQVSAETMRQDLDDYYFMPKPQKLIYTHFPDDPKWQLLDRTMTLTEFENLVYLTSTFFKYGLIITHREAVIRTKQEVAIRIGWPTSTTQSPKLIFKLTYGDGRKDFRGIDLERFGMQEVMENESLFTIRPPEKGSYRLTIYSSDPSQKAEKVSYVNACEYELLCEASPSRVLPFPPCSRAKWGPGDAAAKYNLVPLQMRGILSTVNGVAEVRFQVPKELRFSAKLKSNDKDEKALAGYVMHRTIGDVAVFTINAPSIGEFGLEIFACDPEVDGDSLFHAYQYLIICSESTRDTEELPQMPSGYLGPQPTFKKLGLTASSHPDPYFQTDHSEIEVYFRTTQPLRMTSQLLYASGNSKDDRSQYVLQQSKSNDVVFVVKLPKAGFYKLQIYAHARSESNDNLPGVYNYLIRCTKRQEVSMVPYPQQYDKFKDGCYLHEPLEGLIQKNRISKGRSSTMQHFYFKVDVPKATSMAVVVGKDWTQLERKASGSWEGELDMEKHWGKESKLTVCGQYGGDKGSYGVLLEYLIEP